MNVAEFIFEYLHRRGVEVGFTVTGGGAMFLNEAHRKSKIKSLHNHHEQACAMGAVGYTKANNKPSLVVTTTGCGVANAMTGLLDAYQDSVPVFFMSGNVNKEQMTYFHDTYSGMRKWGMQEANTVAMVSRLVSRAQAVSEPENIGWIMGEMWKAMTHGRKGPVWLDVPLNVQNAQLSDEYCEEWLDKLSPIRAHQSIDPNPDGIQDIVNAINGAERPLLLVGNGARGCEELLNNITLPMVFTYLSADLLPSDHMYNIGRVGTKGDRAGNFAMQNCDLLISIGCSLTTPVTGYNLDHWIPNARLMVTDVTVDQHRYLIDVGKLQCDDDVCDFIKADAKELLTKLSGFRDSGLFKSHLSWSDKTRSWRDKWRVFNEAHDTANPGSLNMYSFIERLGESSHEHCPDSIVVSDAGSSYYTTSQAFQFAKNQTYVTSGAQADMGFTLPAAIGAAIAGEGRRVLAITGDGSVQMNIQELQTLKHHNLPVTLFVLNNGGYLSIRNTIDKFFDSQYIGTDAKSGISFPDLEKIAMAYGIPYYYIDDEDDGILDETVLHNGPCIVEVMCTPKQSIIPTTASKKNKDGTVSSQPLHNMYPFLSDEELEHEMFGVEDEEEKHTNV